MRGLVAILAAWAAACAPAKALRDYVAAFNAADEELYTNAVPNAAAADFLERNVPTFECPDADVERAYAFRWWTYRKHLRKTPDGWVVTEFLPDVGWAGRHNTISCPLGHHLREGRWLRNSAFLDGYLRFMVTKGTVNGPRAYACWPAWAALERAKVTGDLRPATALLAAFKKNYEAWEKGWESRSVNAAGRGVPFRAGFRADRGLFDFVGDREGTEFALSRDGARPLVNAALWAEAQAISEIARAAGDAAGAATFAARADALGRAVREKLWNAKRSFYTTLARDGAQDDVCELHGYAPFYFRMPQPADRLAAWDGLMDARGFFAPVGLVFPRRDTPGFDVTVDVSKHECLWNGPSWPYATSLALTALYETLQGGARPARATAADFAALVGQYARQHVRVRADGTRVAWIDENLHPFTGEWIARRVLIEQARRRGTPVVYRERGKDYNHSTFCDLVIAGLCGVVPQRGDALAVRPLAPASWDWFRLARVRYHGRDLEVVWDRTGLKFGKGRGLSVWMDGVEVGRAAGLGPLEGLSAKK